MTSTGNLNPRARQRDRDPGRDFVVGGVIPLERGLYLNRGADAALFRMAISGEYAHVLAGRQSGKSSLTARVAKQLRDREHLVAVVDVSQIGQRQDELDSARWFYSFAFRLVRQLRIRIDLQDWWQDKSNLTIRQRLTELYWDVILTNTLGPVTIFVDSPSPLGKLPVAEELLASIAAVQNARAAEPELGRLNFIVLSVGEPDRTGNENHLSLLTGSQRLELSPFTLEELQPLQKSLNLPVQVATKAVQRIHFWTGGQPFLTMKLARSVARRIEKSSDINVLIDDCVRQLFAHPGVLHSEPHLNAVQHALLFETEAREKTLAMYGRIRKGSRVRYDPESKIHRNLLGEGMIKVAADQTLVVANRIYALAFPTRWANEHLRIDFRTTAGILALVALVFILPAWYTQVLPTRWTGKIQNPIELADATDAHERMRAWPGHRRHANELLAATLTRRSRATLSPADVREYDRLLRELPGQSLHADDLMAEFHDRLAENYESLGRRDDALLARLNALAVPSEYRQRATQALIGGDYPYLQAAVRLPDSASAVVLNATADKLFALANLELRQYLLGAAEPVPIQPWQVSALRVFPQVSRILVDGSRPAGRIGLELKLAHDRVGDLDFRLTAPTGRSVRLLGSSLRRIDGQTWRASLAGSPVLGELAAEQRAGNWTLSVADRQPGIAGQLLGWEIRFPGNQSFRSLETALPVRDPDANYQATALLSPSARYAVALPTGQDGMAQVWEIGNQQAVAAFPFSEGDQVLGFVLDERVILVQTRAGVRAWTLATGDASWSPQDTGRVAISRLSANRQFLALVIANEEAGVRVYDLIEERLAGELETSGLHTAVALSNDGQWLALADPDRTVRLWKLGNAQPVAEFAVGAAVVDLKFSLDQEHLAIRTSDERLSVYVIDEPDKMLSEFSGYDGWQLTFDALGESSIAGTARQGFRVFDPALGTARSPLIRPDGQGGRYFAQAVRRALLLYSPDENRAKVFRLPEVAPASTAAPRVRRAALSPDGRLSAIEYQSGQLRIEPAVVVSGETAPDDRLGFVGHNAPLESIVFSHDASAVMSAAQDDSVRVWDAESGEPRPFFIRHDGGSPITSIALSADGRFAAIGDATAISWHSALDGELIVRQATAAPVTALGFDPSADTLLAGLENGELVQFDGGGDASARLRGKATAPIVALAFNGDAIAYASADGKLMLIANERASVAEITLGGETCDELYFDSRIICRGAAWLRSVRWHQGTLKKLGARMLPATTSYASLKATREGVSVLIADPLPVVTELRWDYADVDRAPLSDTEQAVWRRRLTWQPQPITRVESQDAVAVPAPTL